jgi:hypothetical protein
MPKEDDHGPGGTGAPPASATSKKVQKVKLPAQLVSLIQGEEKVLQDEGLLLPSSILLEGSSLTPASAPANRVTAAAQERSTRELSSYVRAVCMRMGFVP